SNKGHKHMKMNKIKFTTALLTAALSLNAAYAQIADRKGVTLDEVAKEVNALAQKGDEGSKAQIQKEAKSLANSKNELFVMMSPSLLRFIGDVAKAERVSSNLTKRFPKGIQLLREAFEALIGDESLTTVHLEKKYDDWLKKFPKSYFE